MKEKDNKNKMINKSKIWKDWQCKNKMTRGHMTSKYGNQNKK